MSNLPQIERLSGASPLYARMIAQYPSIVSWIEGVGHDAVSLRVIRDEWQVFATDGSLAELRRFRRRVSLLIAFRSVNDFATERETTAELTRLAEFCLGEVTAYALSLWRARRGEPWDDDLGCRSRFAVIALGKMGGEELNFSSDIDVIYVYEGDGCCRLNGRVTEYTTVEFFTKVAETITQELSAQTEDGFLFRVDTRLRPEGDAGPLVRSTVSLENYYAAAGQTWERLALLKARPVAGDLGIAAELLETLQPFRYPRHPPPSLLAEIAAMKQRNEDAKVSGTAGEINVKLGTGGIREVEFIAQSLQLLHAGRFPFLQTHSTQVAFEQLANYDLFPEKDAKFLVEAYWFLRRVEHRIQMREEEHTHTLPVRAEEISVIAGSMGFAGSEAFFEKLENVRRRVRAVYEEFFAPQNRDDEMEDWWTFFTTAQVPEAVAGKLRLWVEGRAKPQVEPLTLAAQPEASPYLDDFVDALRVFVCGDASHIVTREQVTYFCHLAKSFDTLMPALAQPAVTLRRLARFAARYGTRNQFLNTCASNPQFLRALALLFDRSAYACDLLCEHPEIFEEVLRTGELRAQKNRSVIGREISEGPADGDQFAHWLALYVRAEQLRYAIADLLGVGDWTARGGDLRAAGDGEVAHGLGKTGEASPRPATWRSPLRAQASGVEIESNLSLLADVAVESVLARLPGGRRLLVVALGKYGGAELTFGSDLDILFVAEDGADVVELEVAARRLAQILRGESGTAAFAIDTRLRPHGEAGPLVTTLGALRVYHGGSACDVAPGAVAQFWEKQMLTRARVVCGQAKLKTEFLRWRDELLFGAPITDAELAEICEMRGRIERERNVCEPPQRAFKTCAGGLVDFEFFVQAMQLREGWRRVELRGTSTRGLLAVLGVDGEILENYDFLKRVEIAVRRDENKPVNVLPAPGSEGMEALARWLRFESGEAVWAEYVRRLGRTREMIGGVTQSHAN